MAKNLKRVNFEQLTSIKNFFQFWLIPLVLLILGSYCLLLGAFSVKIAKISISFLNECGYFQ